MKHEQFLKDLVTVFRKHRLTWMSDAKIWIDGKRYDLAYDNEYDYEIFNLVEIKRCRDVDVRKEWPDLPVLWKPEELAGVPEVGDEVWEKGIRGTEE